MAQDVPLEHAASEILPTPADEPAPLAEAAAPPATEEPAATVLPEPPAPRPEPVAGPVSAPVIIGTDEAAGEKKRGWWRR